MVFSVIISRFHLKNTASLLTGVLNEDRLLLFHTLIQSWQQRLRDSVIGFLFKYHFVFFSGKG